MKKCLAFLLCIILPVLTGCFAEQNYRLAYESDQVTSLSIVTEENTFVLPDEVIADFLNDLQKLPCESYRNDPSCTIGKPYLVVTYSNGAREEISASANGVTTNGEVSYGREYFDNADFDALIDQYLNVDMGDTTP